MIYLFMERYSIIRLCKCNIFYFKSLYVNMFYSIFVYVNVMYFISVYVNILYSISFMAIHSVLAQCVMSEL